MTVPVSGTLLRLGAGEFDGEEIFERADIPGGTTSDNVVTDLLWGQGGPPPVTQIPYTWITGLSFRSDLLRNVATIARTGGSTTQRSDAASVGEFGEIEFSAELDTAVDADPANLAAHVLTYLATQPGAVPRMRAPTLVLDLLPRTDVERWLILGRTIGDRIQITGTPVPIVVNANPYFEAGVTSWTATGCTFSQSSVIAHEGTKSGLVTPDGVSTNAFVESEEIPVVAGARYLPSGWLFSPTAYGSANIQINWYDASHAYVSTSVASQSIPANVWTFRGGTTYAAPVTGYARVGPAMGGTPPASQLLYCDEVKLSGLAPGLWPEGTTTAVIEGRGRSISLDRPIVAWNLAAVVGVTPGVPGPWFRFDTSFLDGSDRVPF